MDVKAIWLLLVEKVTAAPATMISAGTAIAAVIAIIKFGSKILDIILNPRIEKVVDKKIIDKMLNEKIEKYLSNINHKQLSTDAHLSRMISHLLLETSKEKKPKEYVWAIGWAFRSFQRYANIYKENEKNYNDFAGDLIKIIADSMGIISNLEITELHEQIKGNNRLNRKTVRMVKDIFDFYENEQSRKLLNNCASVIDYDDFRLLCKNFVQLIILSCPLPANDKSTLENIESKLKDISTYKESEMFNKIVESIDKSVISNLKKDISSSVEKIQNSAVTNR
ncbi:MAG: hypothetical protein LBU89_02085 [Fibromonadaceae bacterium]|nr:hypothetical protein [Fibromonadaceae bacterium]